MRKAVLNIGQGFSVRISWPISCVDLMHAAIVRFYVFFSKERHQTSLNQGLVHTRVWRRK